VFCILYRGQIRIYDEKEIAKKLGVFCFLLSPEQLKDSPDSMSNPSGDRGNGQGDELRNLNLLAQSPFPGISPSPRPKPPQKTNGLFGGEGLKKNCS